MCLAVIGCLNNGLGKNTDELRRFSQFQRHIGHCHVTVSMKGTASTGLGGDVTQRSPIFATAQANLAHDTPLVAMQQTLLLGTDLGVKRFPGTIPDPITIDLSWNQTNDPYFTRSGNHQILSKKNSLLASLTGS